MDISKFTYKHKMPLKAQARGIPVQFYHVFNALFLNLSGDVWVVRRVFPDSRIIKLRKIAQPTTLYLSPSTSQYAGFLGLRSTGEVTSITQVLTGTELRTKMMMAVETFPEWAKPKVGTYSDPLDMGNTHFTMDQYKIKLVRKGNDKATLLVNSVQKEYVSVSVARPTTNFSHRKYPHDIFYFGDAGHTVVTPQDYVVDEILRNCGKLVNPFALRKQRTKWRKYDYVVIKGGK